MGRRLKDLGREWVLKEFFSKGKYKGAEDEHKAPETFSRPCAWQR